MQQLPYLTDATNLDDLVGPDSWTSLHKFGGLEFVDKHPKHWRDCPSYQKMCDLVQSMPVINNSAEHVLGLVSSSYYGLKTTPKTVEQKQNLFKIIHHYRHQQKKLATSSERCTKHVMANFEW